MRRLFLPYVLSAIFAIGLIGLAANAYAQVANPQAEALYNEGLAAMKAKDFATACPKFEEALRLEPQAIGGRLKLAECYEGLVKLASAYASYMLAETMAAAANQPDRQKKAHDAAEGLKPKVARLTITVAEGVRGLAALEVQRDGATVSPAQWGEAVPVNRGQHVVVATATGKQSLEKTIDVSADGVSATVTIDAMPDAQVALTPTSEQPPASTAATLGRQRIAGIVVSGAGMVGLGMALAFDLETLAMVSVLRSQPSLGSAQTQNCIAPAGCAVQDAARHSQVAALVSVGLGAGLVTTGVILFATAPRSRNGEPRVGVAIGPAGALLRGQW